MERLTRPIGTGLAALLVMAATTGFVDVKAQARAAPAPTPGTPAGQQPLQAPTFKTSVSLVSVTAVVRDGKGRVVRNLQRKDFEIFEKGKSAADPRLQGERSGADQPGHSLRRQRQHAHGVEHGSGQARGGVHPELGAAARRRDCAVHVRSRSAAGDAVHERSRPKVRSAMNAMTAIGSTSLYDAIGDTAKKLGDRPSPRRAVVVITDGVDTSSTMKPSDVSGIASAIDVPVYVVAVVSPLDHPGEEYAVVPETAGLGAPREPGPLDGRESDARQHAGSREPGRARVDHRTASPVPARLRGLEGNRVVLARRQNPAPRADRARTQRVLCQSVATVQLKPVR